MSVGRLIMRGLVFQPRAFAGWGLANGGAIVVVAEPTTRLTLVGASRQRLIIHGTSAERLSTTGTSRRRLPLTGSSDT